MPNENELVKLRRDFLESLKTEQSDIFGDSVGIGAQYRTLTLALDTAKLATQPYKIGFPFKSLQVYDATDTNVTVYLKASSQDDSQDWITLTKNNSLEFTKPIREAYLYWTAQTSKSIKIIFLLSGKFATNQFVQTSTGGVTLYDGSAVSPSAGATVAATAAALFASDTSRKMALIQNNGTIPIFISGTSSVTTDTGANPGIKLNPGESFEWRSSAACYFIAASAGSSGKIGVNVFS